MKAFATLRDVIEGTTTASGIDEYLVLLSVSETCRYKDLDLAGFFVVLGAGDAVGVNRERALADVRVEFERVPESHPDGRCEILHHR